MSELDPRIRDLLLELCEASLPEEDLVALARGGSKKGRVTRVATQAGVQTYGVPIGTIITEDMKQAAKMGIMPKPGAKPGPAAAPGLPGGSPGAGALPKPPTGPSGPKDPAEDFNADKTKLQGVGTHPRVPGAKFYMFSDGTGVMEDARGVRSKRQKLDPATLKQKGWNVQDYEDDPADPTAKPKPKAGPSAAERGEQTIKALKATTPKANPKQADAIMAFETRGPQINAALRKGAEPGEENLKVIDGLRGLLENSKTAEPITVHKGMSFNSPEERDSFVSQALRPGTTFVDRGFSVASANRDNAQLHADGDNADNPGVLLDIAVPAGSRAASLNAANGKDDPDQDVLLADGASYRVNKVTMDQGGRPIAEITYMDPMLPAHERAALEDDPVITPEQKEKQRASRFSWSAEDIELDQLLDPVDTEPPAPSGGGSKPSTRAIKTAK